MVAVAPMVVPVLTLYGNCAPVACLMQMMTDILTVAQKGAI